MECFRECWVSRSYSGGAGPHSDSLAESMRGKPGTHRTARTLERQSDEDDGALTASAECDVAETRLIDTWREKNRSLDFQPDVPNQVVREKFQLVSEFGPYLVFHRKS
jgi:hypothetical protein